MSPLTLSAQFIMTSLPRAWHEGVDALHGLLLQAGSLLVCFPAGVEVWINVQLAMGPMDVPPAVKALYSKIEDWQHEVRCTCSSMLPAGRSLLIYVYICSSV